MFRLIAVSLTLTFLLLALFGTSSEDVPGPRSMRAMGMMGALGSEAAASHAREQSPRMYYVSTHHQPLKSAPEPGALVLRMLPHGAEVELIDVGHGNFAQVRDFTGGIGFLPVASLSDMLPD